MEQSFEALQMRMADDSKINKDALSTRINQLSQKLTREIEDTQHQVARTLKTALEDPSFTGLQALVADADARVGRTEKHQAESLSKINRHIAELARAIDAQMSEDRQTLSLFRKDLTQTRTQLEGKVKDIEQSRAIAVIELGERFVNLSNDFKDRTKSNNRVISEKISEIALNTQKDFDDYKLNFERRLEALEENHRNLDSYLERSVETLTTRVDSLEYGLTSVALPQNDGISNASMSAAPTTPLVQPQEPLQVQESPYHLTEAKAQPVMNAGPEEFIGGNAQPYDLTEETQVPAYTQQGQAIAVDYTAPVTTIAEEFVPEPFTPHTYLPTETPAMPATYQSTGNAYASETPYAAQTPYAIDDLPYADPAYAENPVEPMLERPGAVGTEPALKPSLLTGRNLKVAGLALAVMTMGYFALRNFTGNNNARPAMPDDLPAIAQGADSAPVSVSQTDTIGNYADNQGLNANGDAPEGSSLAVAAQSGDAVAEFQLGLSYLQSGETGKAVDLIRSAANKGQPAAQYRLAKLYEAGEGVKADAGMARQLTERAARAGNRIAMHDLALYYAEGRGDVDMNIKTAANWFEKAAERGVVDSQFNLGVLSESGQGLPKNLANAYVWYSIAAAQGDQFARQRLDLLRNQLSSEDLGRADTRVAEFKPLPIDEAANGIFKNNGWGVASKQQIRSAQTLLGNLGYDAGSADGAMGPQTRGAIIEFQKDNGLNETGLVDARLIQSLERARS